MNFYVCTYQENPCSRITLGSPSTAVGVVLPTFREKLLNLATWLLGWTLFFLTIAGVVAALVQGIVYVRFNAFISADFYAALAYFRSDMELWTLAFDPTNLPLAGYSVTYSDVKSSLLGGTPAVLRTPLGLVLDLHLLVAAAVLAMPFRVMLRINKQNWARAMRPAKPDPGPFDGPAGQKREPGAQSAGEQNAGTAGTGKDTGKDTGKETRE